MTRLEEITNSKDQTLPEILSSALAVVKLVNIDNSV